MGRPAQPSDVTSVFPMMLRSRQLLSAAAIAVSVACGSGPRREAVQPVIQFTTVPEAGSGGSERMVRVAGRVTGAAPGQRIVLFAKSGVWWDILDLGGKEKNYLESSATAMFVYAIARGVREGYLPEKYMPIAVRGIAPNSGLNGSRGWKSIGPFLTCTITLSRNRPSSGWNSL